MAKRQPHHLPYQQPAGPTVGQCPGPHDAGIAGRLRGYEEHKDEMVQRLQTEILEKAKRKWLEELNRRTRVEQRL
jgi:hypothetical protein